MEEATHYILCEKENHVPLRTLRLRPSLYDPDAVRIRTSFSTGQRYYETTACVSPSNLQVGEIGFDSRRKVVEPNYDALDGTGAYKYIENLRERVQQLGVEIVHFTMFRISGDPVYAYKFVIYDPVTKYEYKIQRDYPEVALGSVLDRIEKDRKG